MGDSYQYQQALQSHDASATLIHTILREKYGEEAYDWDPVTVALEVQADFQCEMSSESMDKYCAISTVMTSDAFFRRLDAFLGICNTLNSGAPSFDVFDPTTIEEISWAVTEVALNRELLPFSYAVKAYVRKLLDDDGYTPAQYPDVIKELLDGTPDTDAVREAAKEELKPPNAGDANRSNIEEYISEQLTDLVTGFNRIQGLKGLDELILSRGADEALKGQERL